MFELAQPVADALELIFVLRHSSSQHVSDTIPLVNSQSNSFHEKPAKTLVGHGHYSSLDGSVSYHVAVKVH